MHVVILTRKEMAAKTCTVCKLWETPFTLHVQNPPQTTCGLTASTITLALPKALFYCKDHRTTLLQTCFKVLQLQLNFQTPFLVTV